MKKQFLMEHRRTSEYAYHWRKGVIRLLRAGLRAGTLRTDLPTE
jgi:hypothetical protein